MIRFFSNVILLAAILFSLSARGEDPQVAKLEQAPPPKLVEPSIQNAEFPNGLKIYFLENHELPTFEIDALFKVGTIYEPVLKKGLVTMMMSVLATGGSESHTGDEIDKKLEQVASHLESKVRSEYSTFGMKCLSNDIDLALSLFFELIQHPAFDSKKIEIVRHQMLEEISGRNEKPMDIANREFLQQLYGEESVWARHSSDKTVNSFTRDDLMNFYKNFVAPNDTVLIVSGDIDFKNLIAKFKTLIADWPKKEIDFPAISPVEKTWIPGIHFISTATNQSAIVAGHFADKRFNPDKFSLTIANHILGGDTFGSLLGDRIRTDLGLAYSISSRFDFDSDYGPFRIFVNTKSESTAQVIGEMQKMLQKLINGDLTQEPLDSAKNTILNQLIFQYEDPFDTVSTEAIYDFYGYPKHYLSIFQQQIRKVSLEDVKSVAKKYFFPDKLLFMVVGDPKIKGSLNALAPVIELPLDNQ